MPQQVPGAMAAFSQFIPYQLQGQVLHHLLLSRPLHAVKSISMSSNTTVTLHTTSCSNSRTQDGKELEQSKPVPLELAIERLVPASAAIREALPVWSAPAPGYLESCCVLD